MNRLALYGGIAALLVSLVFVSVSPPNDQITAVTADQTPAVAPQVQPVADEHPSAERLRAVGELIDDLGNAVARDNPEPGEHPGASPTDQTITGLGFALNPVTGGLSSIIAGLVLGVGRIARESRRRGEAIIEIDDNPHTPPADQQAISGRARDAVRRVRRKGA